MLMKTRERYDFVEESGVSKDLLRDIFADRKRAGKVVGSHTPEGILRRGVDVEGVLSIDNRALRIEPLIWPGWGRAGVAYGPYDRQNGLALGLFLLNGHNTAQSKNLRETFSGRMDRWLRGSEMFKRKDRLFQWLRSNRWLRTLRQARRWFHTNRDATPMLKMDENMALGWFSKEVPLDPLRDGNAFLMHATGPENGELWASVGGNHLPAIRGVQNLQIYYVIILREKGAAYYAASIPDANGLGDYPYLRPLAIDAFDDSSPLYAGLYQSVLGEIGFRLDTRLYGIGVSKIVGLSTWYGTAHAADQLTGTGTLDESIAEAGGTWNVCSGNYIRTEYGAQPTANDSLAILDPGAPSGLIHTLVESDGSADTSINIIWRFQDEENYWSLTLGNNDCRLLIKESGAQTTVSQSDKHKLITGKPNSVQILDDGRKFALYLQGELLFDSRFTDSRLEAAAGVGFNTGSADRGLYIRQFEAHPRRVKLPHTLDMGEPWLRKGEQVILAEDFNGPAQDLAGKVTNIGSKVWKRDIGKGVIDITGNGSAKIRASVKNPSPGRMAYSVDWDHPEFVDLEVTITPPGTTRGQKEHGLSGFIFWQDENNYFTINIWLADSYGGASISTFFQVDGFEDLYDAIWSNVGARVFWGMPCRFRVVFDGLNYIAFLDDEPVLYRALTDVYPDCKRFSINRVGLISNWEWGVDTGSRFNDFVGRI